MRAILGRGWAGLCALGLALAACTSGMAFGEAACTVSTALLTQVTGECTRAIEALDEEDSESLAISTADVAPFTTVDWTLTVESGRVAITFTDFLGNKQTTEVAPGAPGSGSLRLQLDPLNRLNFTLTPLDGSAQNVEYEIKFVCDCMP